MFTNVGKKIRIFGMISLVLNSISFFITSLGIYIMGIIPYDFGFLLAGSIAIFGGFLVSLLIYAVTYGFATQIKNSTIRVFANSNNPADTHVQPPYASNSPYPQTPPPEYPNPQDQKRTAPLVLGIIGVIFAILLPLVTYCCSIPGLVMANQDIRNSLPNQSARVLNIVALVIAEVNSLLTILIFWKL